MFANSPTQPFDDSNRKSSLATESDVWHSCQVLALQKNLRPTHHVLLRNVSHGGMQQTDPGRRTLGRFQAGLFGHRCRSWNHGVAPVPPTMSPCVPSWDGPNSWLRSLLGLQWTVREHGLFFSFVLLSPCLKSQNE